MPAKSRAATTRCPTFQIPVTLIITDADSRAPSQKLA
jgi:hypothetical protein